MPSFAAAQVDAGFDEAISVRRVNIDVYVTDKKGNRVEDLRREDFKVFEDGEPVEITNFAMLGSDSARADRAAPVDPLAPPAAPAPSEAADMPAVDPEASAHHLVIYVDNLHTRPFNRNRVFAQVRQFIRDLPAGTKLMLITYDREVHVRAPFTTDKQAVIDKTFEQEETSSFVVQKETERDNLIRRLRGNQNDLDSAVSDIDFYSKSAYNDIELSVRGVSSIVERLAGLAGRKSLIYVSDGLDAKPGEDLLAMVYDQFSNHSSRTALPQLSNRYSTRELFRDLTQLANANRVAFYTIDAGGLRASGATSADRGGSQTTDADFTWQLNRQDPLVFMAAETGGLATIGTNNFAGGFGEILADLRTRYSLAIRPRSQEGDGRFHKLEVKVTRPGLELRYRDGYRDKSSSVRLEEATFAAALFGETRNELAIELAFQPAQYDDDAVFLPVEVRIPIGKLTLLEYGEITRGKMRVALAVANDRGDLSTASQQEVPLEIPAAQVATAKGQVFVYTATLRIAAGKQRIVATVRDEYAGTDAFAVRGVDIRKN